MLSRAAEVGEILGPEQGEAAARSGDRRDEQLQVAAARRTTRTRPATPWINVKTGNELVDWTDVDAAEQLFADILDPTHRRAGAGPRHDTCW